MRWLVLAFVLLAVARADAQAWPDRPIRLVVPATPGGAIDVIARMVADRLTLALGQPVIVENKPGAANNLGTDLVAKSAPDGYTLVIVASSHATNKSLYKQLPYDPVADFAPIVSTHVVPLVLAVHPELPVTNVRELVAWIKANPGEANYASSGTGSSLHMAAELFMAMTGTKMLHVPYKGSSAAHPDLLAGRTKMIFDPLTAIQGHVKSGRVRAIAVTTATRSASLPDVPTVAEQGLAGYDTSTWGGILAPAGTPAAVIMRLNAEINKVLENPEVRAKLTGGGIDVQGGTPEQFADIIKSEVAKWAKVVQEAGITPE